MSERNLWKRAHDQLSPFGRFVRVENPAEPGTPDVCYLVRRYKNVEPCCGWIELKHLPEWPTRASSAIVIDELTIAQVNWQTGWAEAGGRAWTLLQAEKHLLLLTPAEVRRLFRREHTKASLIRAAAVCSPGPFPAPAIIKCLTST